MKIFTERKQKIFIWVFIFGVVALIYWRVLSLPFIADDWWYVRKFQTSDTLALLRYFFDPSDKYVYRPLGETGMAVTYLLFGFNPAPMHWITLSVHAVCSYLVFLILEHLLESKSVACLSAIVYASAIAVHFDIYAWAWATYYDIGAIFFLLLSILLYLKEKQYLSSLAYLVGCLFKPLAVLLPVLFVFHFLTLSGKKWSEIFSFRSLIIWIPFVIIGGVILGMKFLVSTSIGFGEEGAYAISIWGEHLITNAVRYLTWMFQAVFPFYVPQLGIYKIIVFLCVLIFLSGVFAMLMAIKRDKAFLNLVFLLIWLIVGLIPAYLLPNHTYRYYAAFSLPAFAALFFYAIRYLFSVMKVSQRVGLAVFVLLGCIAVGGSFIQSIRIFNDTVSQNSFADGTNLLIRRAATHGLVTERLRKDFPILPPGLVIVLVNADIGSFGYDNSALQYLFDSDAFELLPPSAVIFKNGSWYFLTPDSAPQYLDPSLAAVYELSDDTIIRRELVNLLEPTTLP